MRYFNEFPVITYKGKRVRDITRRVKVLERARNYSTLYYRYNVKDGERPDTIAYNYYGSSYYFWVIYLVNNMVDPYYDWPLTQGELDKMCIEKYGSLLEAQDTILHYKKIESTWYVKKTDYTTAISEAVYLTLDALSRAEYTAVGGDDEVIISVATWEDLTNEDKLTYEPVYAYNYEFDKNEAKRQIKLLDLKYLPMLERDFKAEMKRI